MPFVVEGADDYRRRLIAIANIWRPTAEHWQNDASSRMRAKARTSGRLKATIRGGRILRSRAEVVGDYRLIFVDRGRKEEREDNVRWRHSPRPGKAYRAFRFQKGSETVYSRKLAKVRRRPFIVSSARAAIKADPMTPELIRLWNGAGSAGRLSIRGTGRRAGAVRLP